MDLRVIMVAVLLVQSVLPAPICLGIMARCADGRLACAAADVARGDSACCVARPLACAAAACERGPADATPCRPVCVPCPLGQPLAPTRTPTQATPAELALLPAGPAIIIDNAAAVPPPGCERGIVPIVGPEYRSLLCIWLI